MYANILIEKLRNYEIIIFFQNFYEINISSYRNKIVEEIYKEDNGKIIETLKNIPKK